MFITKFSFIDQECRPALLLLGQKPKNLADVDEIPLIFVGTLSEVRSCLEELDERLFASYGTSRDAFLDALSQSTPARHVDNAQMNHMCERSRGLGPLLDSTLLDESEDRYYDPKA